MNDKLQDYYFIVEDEEKDLFIDYIQIEAYNESEAIDAFCNTYPEFENYIKEHGELS